MARKRDQGGDVLFAVEYEDGRTSHISIDKWTLNRGDHVARIVAGERQQKGEIPDGKIVSVKRLEGLGRP